MPVTIARPGRPASFTRLRERRLRHGAFADRGKRLRVELVNNMPDAGAFATQRQFIKLLEQGAQDFDVTLGFMTLESVERSDEAKREMAELYRPAAFLPEAATDAVIVTGAEPRASEFDQEPYWNELTRLFDQARTHAYATLASCLAAHALVQHTSDLRRRRTAQKWSGLYECEVVSHHALTEGLSAGAMPHSRWNGLDEAELREKGFVILTRSTTAGVDMFADDDDHLSLFFQGHPEYDSDTLAREYRRDVLRALDGASLPRPPLNYYTNDVEVRLVDHVAGMMAGTQAPHMPRWAMKGPEPIWRERGGVVVRNWLRAISTRKMAAEGAATLRARCGG